MIAKYTLINKSRMEELGLRHLIDSANPSYFLNKEEARVMDLYSQARIMEAEGIEAEKIGDKEGARLFYQGALLTFEQLELTGECMRIAGRIGDRKLIDYWDNKLRQHFFRWKLTRGRH